MALSRLDIHHLRNLSEVSLRELGAANIFYGENGSGKTSVLEALHMLGMARSFRTGQLRSLISHEQTRCTVYGENAPQGSVTQTLGVSRERDGALEARIGGEPVRALSELAAELPLQVINADTFHLLTGAPEHRRQFLDWGVFHVEHGFHAHWQRYQRALKQRNSLLRRGKISPDDLRPWDTELSEAGEYVDRMRSAYFRSIQEIFDALISRLSPDLTGLELRYRRGWDKESTLADSLIASRDTDLQQGFTHVGPQRADIKVLAEGLNAAEVLSRGQQKIVVCGLKLAQGQLLSGNRRRACIYLVDDLPAELDRTHCRLVVEVLEELKTQVFITCVQQREIADIWPTEGSATPAMFHVEHGSVQRV